MPPAALSSIKNITKLIAGVNIPMLVETLMARDDDPSFDELVALAVEKPVAKA